MESLYLWGARFIEKLQEQLWDYQYILTTTSAIGDPPKASTWLFPIAFLIDMRLGIKVLLTAGTSEWINVILKWMLYEERPYWWVGENSKYQVILKQLPLTCETGPGSPSGHVMVTAAACYVIVEAAQRKILLGKLLWIPYLMWVALMMCSRLFIAAHFPHQVLLGFIIGLALGITFAKMDVEDLQLSHYISYALLPLISTAGIYIFMPLLDIDPDESIYMATKWCIDPTYVNVASRPFYGIMRNSGAPLGLGLGMTLHLGNRILEAPDTPVILKLLIGVGWIFVNSLIFCLPRPEGENMMYFVTGLQYTLYFFLVTALSPFLLYKAVSLIHSYDTKHE